MNFPWILFISNGKMRNEQFVFDINSIQISYMHCWHMFLIMYSQERIHQKTKKKYSKWKKVIKTDFFFVYSKNTWDDWEDSRRQQQTHIQYGQTIWLFITPQPQGDLRINNHKKKQKRWLSIWIHRNRGWRQMPKTDRRIIIFCPNVINRCDSKMNVTNYSRERKGERERGEPTETSNSMQVMSHEICIQMILN